MITYELKMKLKNIFKQKKSMNAGCYVENWLKENGFRSERLSDKILGFRYEGLNLFCFNHEDDPQFLRIVMPNTYNIENNR